MKVKNFPERKRQRQLNALQRLTERNNELEKEIQDLSKSEFVSMSSSEKLEYVIANSRTLSWIMANLQQIENLQERTAQNMRHVRTKKTRPGRR